MICCSSNIECHHGFDAFFVELAILVACLLRLDLVHSFLLPRSSAPLSLSRPNLPSSTSTSNAVRHDRNLVVLSATGDDKFSFYQRIESLKTAVVGLLAGGFAAAPFTALHDLPAYGAASWEFDTDMGSLQSALFAIVYRYCVREEDDNDMLNMGVVGAFVVTRTLSWVRVPSYCTTAPLDCGDPLGYFDYDMIRQLALNGLESVALFGGAALAMEYAYSKKWIGKFPN